MLALERWGEGKPLFLRMFAQGVAASADATYEVLRAARAGKNIDGRDDLPPYRQWAGLYKDHHIHRDALEPLCRLCGAKRQTRRVTDGTLLMTRARNAPTQQAARSDRLSQMVAGAGFEPAASGL